MRNSTSACAIACFLGVCSFSSAADPAWWSSNGVLNSSPSQNFSLANIGQAKHMVSQALAELELRLPGAVYASLKADVNTIVDLTLPTTTAEYENQKKVLLVGQLKALADPFYRHLYNVNPMWLEVQMRENQTISGTDPNHYFPWTASASDDVNKAIATIGQLKSVFALRFSGDDADGNLLPDFWEYQYFGGTGNIAGADSDADGLTNAQEATKGTNPFISDTDGDHVNDDLDPYPLDSARWAIPANTDGTPPQIILISPENAVPLP